MRLTTWPAIAAPKYATLGVRTFIASALMAFGLCAMPAQAQPRSIPSPVHGLTIDAVDHLSDIVTALRALSVRPTTRIVFDAGVQPSDYLSPARQIYPVSYVMGEILDSAFVKSYSISQYAARTTDYLNTLFNYVDVWEVGNEVNGEWLGTTSDVVAKITDAFNQVKARGGRTALTLYYNGPADDGSKSCWSQKGHQMFTWAQANVPYDLKQRLDYVLVSYYEDDCNGLQPDWNSVFQQLSTMFPNSLVGFGENGTNKKDRKEAYIRRYYGIRLPSVPNYIRGNFWWYGKQDFVPSSKLLWGVFNEVTSAP